MKGIQYKDIIAILCFSVLLPLLAKAQDPRFTQFYNAPTFTNPAMAGIFKGEGRLNLMYRSQWGSVLGSVPFRTIAAGYDVRFNIAHRDFLAIGLNVLNDKVGDGHLVQNRAYVNISYQKQLSGSRYNDRAHYLVAGGQVGGGQNQINWNNFWFSEQFDLSMGGFPNTSLENRESNLLGDKQNSDVAIDFNAGLLYYAVFSENLSVYGGAAMYHINNPKISFGGTAQETIERRITLNGGGQIGLTEQISILPAAIYMQQGVLSSWSTGANVRYSNGDFGELSLRAGLWSHFSSTKDTRAYLESMAVTAVLEYGAVNLGISYDITMSHLTVANNNKGGFELSMMYTTPEKRRIKTTCPKF